MGWRQIKTRWLRKHKTWQRSEVKKLNEGRVGGTIRQLRFTVGSRYGRCRKGERERELQICPS